MPTAKSFRNSRFRIARHSAIKHFFDEIPIQRLIAGLLCLLLAFGNMAAIFVLTEQSARDTTRLSSHFERMLDEDAPDYIKRLHNRKAKTFLGVKVRTWAHVGEFAPLGAFSASAIVLLRGKNRRLRGAAGLSVIVCAAYSLFDQTHEIFVPGRHFDFGELGFDALGYLVGIAAVVGAAAIFRACYARRNKVARRTEEEKGLSSTSK